MRTTITLESDVEKLIRREERKGRSFKDIVNVAIRRGLTQAPTTYEPVFPTFDLTLRPGVDPNQNFNRLASAIEDEAVLAKLSLGR